MIASQPMESEKSEVDEALEELRMLVPEDERETVKFVRLDKSEFKKDEPN